MKIISLLPDRSPRGHWPPLTQMAFRYGREWGDFSWERRAPARSLRVSMCFFNSIQHRNKRPELALGVPGIERAVARPNISDSMIAIAPSPHRVRSFAPV